MIWEHFRVSLSESYNMSKWKLVLATPAGNRIWIRMPSRLTGNEALKNTVGYKVGKTSLSCTFLNHPWSSEKKAWIMWPSTLVFHVTVWNAFQFTCSLLGILVFDTQFVYLNAVRTHALI